MGKSSESVRFMDDVDIAITMDNRSTDAQQSTNIDVSVKPIIFRASYRDIVLISTIMNKAITLYGNISHSGDDERDSQLAHPAQRPPIRSLVSKASKVAQSQLHPVGHARVLVAKELVSLFMTRDDHHDFDCRCSSKALSVGSDSS